MLQIKILLKGYNIAKVPMIITGWKLIFKTPCKHCRCKELNEIGVW